MRVTSERISRSSSFKLQGKVDEVFPLFGPVLEKEWAEGWEPDVIYPSTELLEKGMIFRTTAGNDREGHYTWILSHLDADQHFIDYTVFTPLRIWVISVHCQPHEDHTSVTVSYTYTGTTAEGNALNRRAMDEIFEHDLRDWQEALNHYLVKKELTQTPK